MTQMVSLLLFSSMVEFAMLSQLCFCFEFLKLHIAIDAKSKIMVSFRITRGNVHDAKKFCPLVRESSEKYNIDKVYADKAHDNRNNFNLLDDLNQLLK
ncbi:MAG: transposase [Candidatus Nitrosopolaris sp.]